MVMTTMTRAGPHRSVPVVAARLGGIKVRRPFAKPSGGNGRAQGTAADSHEQSIESLSPTTAPDAEAAQEEPYRFSKMREHAWDRFLLKSADLAAAHHAAPQRRPGRRSRTTAVERECGRQIALWFRLARWVTTVFGSGSARPRAVPEPAAVSVPERPKPGPRPRPGALLDRAVRGAQAGRAAAGEARGKSAEEHWRTRPAEDRPRPSQTSPIITDWEKHFDAFRHLSGFTRHTEGFGGTDSARPGPARVPGGAAWA
jgi:hypothetical protein